MTRIALVLLVELALVPLAHAAAQELPDFARLVRDHRSIVVNISTLQRGRTLSAPETPEATADEDSFRPFDQSPDTENATLGSGLIVSNDGYILTCAHVVEDAREIVVRLIDRREFSARLVGSDARSDVALLKIEAGSLPIAIIGNPGKLEVGEWVLAIGAPFGFQHSATSGIVSAKGRSLPHESYTPFIQTDVAINPGNSGGPLFNLRGEVVGVNSQIYGPNGGFAGVSFAIPIDLAMSVAEQLKREGRLRRGWLGVSPQDVTRGLALAYGLDRTRGALISDILPDSPASRSELRAGDIVLAYQGKPVEFASDLPLLAGQTPPRTRVTLRVFRRALGIREVQVTVGELQQQAVDPSPPPRASLALTELTEALRRQAKVNYGVVIARLDAAARRAGLRSGDIVSEIDGKRVDSTVEFQRLLAQVPVGKYVVLRVHRGPQALFVALQPGE